MPVGRARSMGSGPAGSQSDPAPGGTGSVRVVVEVTRGGSVEQHRARVPVGTAVRAVLRQVGCAPEGSAVMIDGTSVPLDTPIERPLRLTVVPTFSGG